MNEKYLQFLRDSLAHHRDLRNALDTKASLLLGLSGVVFALSVKQIEELPFFIFSSFSLISVLLLILVVRRPFRRKKHIGEGLMCWWSFRADDYEGYKEEIAKVKETDEKIAEEYTKEIWNLAQYSLRPKTILLRWSSFVLTLGLFIGFLLFFI